MAVGRRVGERGRVLLAIWLVRQADVDDSTVAHEYPGAYYHVMNRGLSRRNIFLEDKDRERFLELLGETSRQ